MPQKIVLPKFMSKSLPTSITWWRRLIFYRSIGKTWCLCPTVLEEGSALGSFVMPMKKRLLLKRAYLYLLSSTVGRYKNQQNGKKNKKIISMATLWRNLWDTLQFKRKRILQTLAGFPAIFLTSNYQFWEKSISWCQRLMPITEQFGIFIRSSWKQRKYLGRPPRWTGLNMMMIPIWECFSQLAIPPHQKLMNHSKLVNKRI